MKRIIRQFAVTFLVSGSASLAIAVVDSALPPQVQIYGSVAEAAVGIRTPSSLCFWENVDWDDMSPQEQEAWELLGWNKSSWDDRGSAPDNDWADLSQIQRAAAQSLGYTGSTWDNFDTATCTNP
jgi:hypothetical protein